MKVGSHCKIMEDRFKGCNYEVYKDEIVEIIGISYDKIDALVTNERIKHDFPGGIWIYMKDLQKLKMFTKEEFKEFQNRIKDLNIKYNGNR